MKKVAYIRASNIYDDSRATKEITALLKKGYYVHILGWNRDGSAEKRIIPVFEKWNKNIKVSFFNQPVNSNGGVSRIHNLYLWTKWVRRTIQKEFYDYFHLCNLESALGIRIKKNATSRFIYDIYDYYVDSHNMPNLLKRIVEKIEINVIDNSDLTIICTEERKKQIAKASPKRLLVIYNSPDVKNTVSPSTDEFAYDYAYCGTMNGGRLIKEIFEGYLNNSDLRFAIAGNGSNASVAKTLSEEHKNFSYFGSVSYNEVIELEKKAKVLSAIYDPSNRNHQLCAPNKFYESLALGKPIIVCRGTGIDKIVEENHLGAVIDYSAEAFYKSLKLLVDDKEECINIGKRAKEIYEANYKWSLMEARLIEFYESI